jgi:hypothetical protein
MSAHGNWWPILFLFVLPLMLGAGLVVVAFRCRRKWIRIGTGTGGVLLILLFLGSVVQTAPYLWALHLESKWFPAHPATRAELESFLSLYSRHDIQPSQSYWGHDHQLQPGERMTQYLLLWREPLDVVYRSNDTIVAIYTSYE